MKGFSIDFCHSIWLCLDEFISIVLEILLGNLLIPKQHKSKRMNKLQVIFVLALAASAANADEFTCFSHVEVKKKRIQDLFTILKKSSLFICILFNYSFAFLYSSQKQFLDAGIFIITYCSPVSSSV